MNKSAAQYKKELRKKLTCGYAARQKLIKQFDHSLSLYLEETPAPSMEMLYSDFGSPEDMVKILMSSLSQEELSAYRKEHRIRQIIAGILLAVFIGFTLFIYFIKQKPIISNVEIFPSEPVASASDIVEK